MNDEVVKVNLGKRLVILPRVFRDYRNDFGKDQHEVLMWLVRNTSGKEQIHIKKIILPPNQQIQIFFFPPTNKFTLKNVSTSPLAKQILIKNYFIFSTNSDF
jgi:hypothetical protein